MDQKPKHTNPLIHETSPYLLQHAHNPVYWQAWNTDRLEEAAKKDKLIIISIGYSACHWCHVMEHESFEDEDVAEIMNNNFVNIKIDREERPDLDQVYMNAVQIMTGSGGWPMNIVALPDGRPVWGGTYFRKEQWKDALSQLAKLYRTKPEEMKDYATKLQQGLQQLQIIDTKKETSKFSRELPEQVIHKWKKDFDLEYGGMKRAPKFMMPNNYAFLLRYAYQEDYPELMDFVTTTLTRMSWGGIYDHVGGGFSRYSVDEKWHIPHFEKMLYDNAQLVSLYSKAYALTKNPKYKEVVSGSLEFVKAEFTNSSGAFYSAWDADSADETGKNREGAFFSWEKEELQKLLKEDFEIFANLYNINDFGKWEHDQYVLIQTRSLKEISKHFGLKEEELQKKNEQWLKLLKTERENRKKPGLDDKSLTSWNALMITGLVDAYKALGEKEYLEIALRATDFIKKHQLRDDLSLYHVYKNGRSSINGYLEDYAFCIEAFLLLYEATREVEHLELAQRLTEKCYEDFHDPDSGFFFFTSRQDAPLITRPIEITDNVMPASNSVMAKNLFKLAKLTENRKYRDSALMMLKRIQKDILSYPGGYSNWLDLMLNYLYPYYEVVVTGKKAPSILPEFEKEYLPNVILAGTTRESELPLFQDRFLKDKNYIYICQDSKCELPLTSVEKSIKLIKQF